MIKLNLSIVLFIFFVSSSHAALIDRGNGLIYDDYLDITWLADANYAMTSGYDADGRMFWSEAMIWADQLVYAGSDQWRLPTSLNTDGTGPCGPSSNCVDSELGHLFYIDLGVSYPQPISTSTDLDYNMFINIEDHQYWTSTEWVPTPTYPTTTAAWWFNFSNGNQDFVGKENPALAWAVHDGDIGAVPLPGAIWLFLSGIVGFIGINRLTRRPSRPQKSAAA